MNWIITFRRAIDGKEILIEAKSAIGATRQEIDDCFLAAKSQLSMASDWAFVKASGR